MCGEKLAVCRPSWWAAGSPPHVRGKDCRPCRPGCFPRITPARAGKSFKMASSFFKSRDHPRACGEKTMYHAPGNCESKDHPRACGEKENAGTSNVEIKGSPPRVRGKGADCLHVVARPGITPARAGKS